LILLEDAGKEIVVGGAKPIMRRGRSEGKRLKMLRICHDRENSRLAKHYRAVARAG
jgi:hypothetical protein